MQSNLEGSPVLHGINTVSCELNWIHVGKIVHLSQNEWKPGKSIQTGFGSSHGPSKVSPPKIAKLVI